MAMLLMPEPVKYFVALLWSDAKLLPSVQARMAAQWGDSDFAGPDRPFDRTTYYDAEMGPSLFRRLMSFETLRSPEEIAAAKLACIEMEKAFAIDGRRRVNLDIGYLDHNKIVLASVKSAGQKIYLREGIYADLVARYADGRYQPFPWTFPDFKDGRYDGELNVLRENYLRQMKCWRSNRV
jgi:hypothetical protein